MLDQVLTMGALNCVYAVVAFVSFIFAVLSLIGHEFGDILDFHGDVDTHTDLDFAHISPFALAMFGATFGLVGLITTIWLEMDAVPSILVSAGVGVVVGGVAQALFIFVLSPSKSSHFSLEQDAIGREAEVTITIPGEGQGQIAYSNVSGRVKLGARSLTGEKISTGQLVTIVHIVGRSAMVRPIEKK